MYTHPLVLVKMLKSYSGGGRIRVCYGLMRISNSQTEDVFVVGIQISQGSHWIPKLNESNIRWIVNNQILLGTFNEICTLYN